MRQQNVDALQIMYKSGGASFCCFGLAKFASKQAGIVSTVLSPVSLTPAKNLSAVSLTPLNNFSSLTLTPGKNFRRFGYF
jgi:hypothetical protein